MELDVEDEGAVGGGGLRPEEAGLKSPGTKEQDAKAGDWLGDLLLAGWFDTAQHEWFRVLGIVG